jgi:hypothetical protein
MTHVHTVDSGCLIGMNGSSRLSNDITKILKRVFVLNEMINFSV